MINSSRDEISNHGLNAGQKKTSLKQQQEEEKRLEEIKKRAIALYNKEAYRIHQLKKTSANELLNLTPNEFEEVVADLFRKLGYNVIQTSYSNDGGKDAIAWKSGKKYLIECKRYDRSKKIGRPMLQKFHAAMIEENAHKGFFVTTAFFTTTAYEYARKFKIELIHGNKLVDLMRQAFPDSHGNIEFKQLCLQCGDELTFKLNGQDEMLCINNHTVKKEIPKYKGSSYYHYRYKNKW